MTDEREPKRVSRRTIAKGAAWAVPAVPLVLATPAYAVSGGGPTGQFLGACKQPGNSCNTGTKPYGFRKGYTFVVRYTNCTSEPVYIYPTVANIDNPDSANPLDFLNPRFQVTSSVPFVYSSARKFTGGAIGSPLAQAEIIPAKVGDVCGTLDIIINAADLPNSTNTDASGYLYMAWGHTATVGGDPDHPYVPAPPATPPSSVGEGWIYTAFSYASTPPCGTDCAPGGDVTPT